MSRWALPPVGRGALPARALRGLRDVVIIDRLPGIEPATACQAVRAMRRKRMDHPCARCLRGSLGLPWPPGERPLVRSAQGWRVVPTGLPNRVRGAGWLTAVCGVWHARHHMELLPAARHGARPTRLTRTLYGPCAHPATDCRFRAGASDLDGCECGAHPTRRHTARSARQGPCRALIEVRQGLTSRVGWVTMWVDFRVRAGVGLPSFGWAGSASLPPKRFGRND